MDQQVEVQMMVRNHAETLTFDVTPLGKHNIVLGLPWLQWHNPTIHWTSGKVTFASNYCEEHCLAQPASTFLNQHPIVPMVAVENEDLGLAFKPLLEQEIDLFAVEIPEHLESVAEHFQSCTTLRSMSSMDRRQSMCSHRCMAPMWTSQSNWTKWNCFQN